MGKGVAAEFRNRYPDMFEQYRKICAQKLLEPGKLWLWKASDQWVLNFPTKRHWRQPSKLEWIEAGLKKFTAEYERRGISEISFPRLGCGNGGLDWNDVRPLMEAHLAEVPIPVYIHDFEVNIGSPEHLEASSRLHAIRIDRSFGEFIDALRAAVQDREGKFRSLGLDAPFTAEFESESRLRLNINGGSVLIDVDDLRSIWLKLLKGVVTTRAADWGPTATGDHILSLLSELPDVRTIQIQRRTAEHPELAVELRRRSGTQVAEDINFKPQELAWG